MLTSRTDNRLITLGDELEKARAQEKTISRDETAPDSKVERAYARVANIVRKIEAEPAQSLEGMRVKARAIAWCHGDEPIALKDEPTTDVRLAQSIIADLLRTAA